MWRMSQLPGQAQRGVERRAAIVDAALEVFAVRGYRSSALAEIAERVDVTPGGILYHFGSKQALLLAVIAERDRRAGDLLDGALDGSGTDALRSVVRIAALCEDQPGLAALHTVLQIESLEPGAPAHAYFAGRSEFLRSAVEDILVRGQDTGEVAVGIDCAAMAAEFIAFLEGASVVWLMDRSLSLVSLYDTYIESFIARLARSPHDELA
jgi:AcrR family transcriptional regulator